MITTTKKQRTNIQAIDKRRNKLVNRLYISPLCLKSNVFISVLLFV